MNTENCKLPPFETASSQSFLELSNSLKKRFRLRRLLMDGDEEKEEEEKEAPSLASEDNDESNDDEQQVRELEAARWYQPRRITRS